MSVLGLFFPWIHLLHGNLGKVPLPSARPKISSVVFLLAAPLPSPISCSYELSFALNPISNHI